MNWAPMNNGRPTLLLCYDGSPYARHAVKEAGRLFPGAEAVVLNVWVPVERVAAAFPAAALTAYSDGVDDVALEEASDVAHHGAELAERAGFRSCERVVQMGSGVSETVEAAADECGADIIVTGARGIGGVHELFSGSLSHQLIRDSRKPVLAIPTPDDYEEDESGG